MGGGSGDPSDGQTVGRNASAGGRPRDPAIEEAIIRAARKRLATDGYSAMTIGDIVADAGVSRPTLYRRWANKYDLVLDALRYGFEEQRKAYPAMDFERMAAVDAFKEAMRRLDPSYHNEAAMALHGTFIAEAERVPGLMEQLREHGIRPRCDELLETLRHLQRRGDVREDLDLDTMVTMCFGSYFAAYLRGSGSSTEVPDLIVGTLWPLIATHPG